MMRHGHRLRALQMRVTRQQDRCMPRRQLDEYALQRADF
jgi:hypothetical protein